MLASAHGALFDVGLFSVRGDVSNVNNRTLGLWWSSRDQLPRVACDGAGLNGLGGLERLECTGSILCVRAICFLVH